MSEVKTGSVRHTPRMLVENGNVEIMKIKTSRWRPKYRQHESTPTHNVRNFFLKHKHHQTDTVLCHPHSVLNQTHRNLLLISRSLALSQTLTEEEEKINKALIRSLLLLLIFTEIEQSDSVFLPFLDLGYWVFFVWIKKQRRKKKEYKSYGYS